VAAPEPSLRLGADEGQVFVGLGSQGASAMSEEKPDTSDLASRPDAIDAQLEEGPHPAGPCRRHRGQQAYNVGIRGEAPVPGIASDLCWTTMRCSHQRLDRRTFLGLLGIGLAAATTSCTSSAPTATRGPLMPSAPPTPLPTPSTSGGTNPEQPPPLAVTDTSRVLHAGPAGTRQIALTIDDGYCNDCVAGYVEFAHRTGTHLTFSPNGLYAHAWAPHVAVLAPLIANGQVQIINHTFSHPRLITLSPAQVRTELERNETWINRTFATTAQPYYRPPYGLHNRAVDDAAAEVGLDRVMLWNGSFGDSQLLTPRVLIDQARRYLQPGVIMLGHANHPTVLGLFDQITQLIRTRALQPVTLDEMFGTHRPARPG